MTRMAERQIIRKGTQVAYRGGFGSDAPKIAVVKSIEKTELPREKYGDEVMEVTLDDHFVLTLDNGHWCYSDQVDGIVGIRSSDK